MTAWHETTTYADLGTQIDRARTSRPDIAVVSFDVFDTLLVRRCTRTAVLQHVTRRVVAELDHRGVSIDPDVDLLALRAQIGGELATAASAAGRDHEFLIDDLYPELLRQVAGDAIPVADRTQLAANLVEGEVDAEVRACVAIPASLAAVRRLRDAGARLIVTSDMYLGSQHLNRILSALGYSDLFDDIYASGDGTGYKITGNAFRHALQRQGIGAEQLLHIGDHENADIAAARDLGINTLQIVDPVLDDARLAERVDHANDEVGEAFAISRWTEMPRTLPTQNGARNGAAETNDFDESYGYTVLGPIFAAFLHRTVARALSDGIDTLYFLSRDGYAPMAMYEAVARAGLLPTGAPESRYLAVSRLPTMRSLVGSRWSAKAVESASNQLVPEERTLRNTLLSLGVDAEPIETLANNYGYELDEPMTASDVASPALASLMASDPVVRLTAGTGANARALLEDYLEQEGLFDSGRVGLVDIGWGGTIQEQLFLAVGERLPGAELFGYYLGGNVSLFDRHHASNHFVPILGSVFTPHGGMLLGNSAIWASVALLEEAARAPHGTCRGYERRDGRVVPVIKADADRPGEVAGEAGLAGLQRGMIAYGLEYFDAVGFLNVSPYGARRLAMLAMQRLVFSPSRDELDFWQRLTHTNDIGGLFNIRERLLPDHAADWRAPRSIVTEVRNSMWTQGAAHHLLGSVGGAAYNAYWALSYARKRQADINNFDDHGYELEPLFWEVQNTADPAAESGWPDTDRREPRHIRRWVGDTPTDTDELFATALERTATLSDKRHGLVRPLINWAMLANLTLTLAAAAVMPRRATRGVRISNDSAPLSRLVRRRAAALAAPALVRTTGRATHPALRTPRRVLRRLLRW